MKNTIITLASVAALAVSANAQTSLSAAGGTFLAADGNTVTYTVATLNSSATDLADAGDIRNQSNNGAGSITFTFDAPVDFFVTNTTSNSGTVFDATASLTTFTADSGTWAAVNLDPDLAFTVTDNIVIGEHPVTGLNSNIAWGSLEISGVRSVTYSNLGAESFNISASSDVVPEPSSTALLGLGALGLLARRKR